MAELARSWLLGWLLASVVAKLVRAGSLLGCRLPVWLPTGFTDQICHCFSFFLLTLSGCIRVEYPALKATSSRSNFGFSQAIPRQRKSYVQEMLKVRLGRAAFHSPEGQASRGVQGQRVSHLY